MPLFKPNKVGIAPTPYVTTTGALVSTKRNNFINDNGPTTLFVFLPGNIEAYTDAKNGLIKKMSESFKAVTANTAEKDTPKGIPQNQFFDNEENAFKAAKEKYPQHAFVIMQLSIAKKELVAIDDVINGKNVPVYNVNLLEHVQSVNAFKSKENYTLNGEPQGTTYIKSGKGDNAAFKSEADFKSPVIQTKR